VRLAPTDLLLAKRLFAVMADVFAEACEKLSDEYIEQLLAREEFWALAACAGEEVVGGLTAHALPMTRSECRELFVYDVAVHRDHQRRGIGRQLLNQLRQQAQAAGIGVVFVAVDDDDVHALDFYRAVGGEPSPVTLFTFTRWPCNA
jgi:aminoglycoside 3-N-acetyltransferase I